MARPVLLAVDDDPEVLRAIERDLRRRYGADYRVVRAESGEAALQAIRELKERGMEAERRAWFLFEAGRHG